MHGKGMIIVCLWAKFLKMLFIVPTDAHYYKTIEMLKQFTNLKL